MLDIDKITKRISGKRISHVEARDEERLAIVFVDGEALLISRQDQGPALDFESQDGCHECSAALRPTLRQREYLDFIEKYMLRFGISPAESDIQRHFLVSAPSVNSMVQALERHGFIMRQRGIPRSAGGTIHLTPVWFLFRVDRVFVGANSASRKVR